MPRGAAVISPTAGRTREGRHSVLFSRREAAELAGLKLRAVDKALEQGVIKPARTGRGVWISLGGLLTLLVLGDLPLTLRRDHQRRMRHWLESLPEPAPGSEFPLGANVIVRVSPELAERAHAAERYARLRDRHIVSDPEIKGGEPVIDGTRLTAAAVSARLAGADTLQDLVEDYPYIEPEVLEVAAVFGRTHPRRGRPPRPARPATR